MTAVTIQSNKIVSKEVKDKLSATRAIVGKKLKFCGQPNNLWVPEVVGVIFFSVMQI